MSETKRDATGVTKQQDDASKQDHRLVFRNFARALVAHMRRHPDMRIRLVDGMR